MHSELLPTPHWAASTQPLSEQPLKAKWKESKLHANQGQPRGSCLLCPDLTFVLCEKGSCLLCPDLTFVLCEKGLLFRINEKNTAEKTWLQKPKSKGLELWLNDGGYWPKLMCLCPVSSPSLAP